MKKYFFFAACASVAFASCVNDVPDAPVNDEQHAITFDTPVVQSNSRGYGREIGPGYKNDVDFKVMAWYNSTGIYETGKGNVFFSPEFATVSLENGTWYPTYTKDGKKNYYYWPKEGSLTFLAYSPASLEDVSVSDKSLKIKDYTVKSDGSTLHTDLLVSDKNYDEVEQNSVVTIKFHHALSSILFNAKLGGNYPGATVTLTGINLTNINSVGDFDQKLDDAKGELMRLPIKTDEMTQEELEKATYLSQNAPTWTSNTPETYTVENITTQVLSEDLYYPSTNSENAPTNASETDFRLSDFILIPQTIADDAYLVVAYKIKVGDGPEIVESTAIQLKTLTIKWDMGYRYIYNIVISLNPITFKPSVEAWVDAEKPVTP